jgi:hypothetical protein
VLLYFGFIVGFGSWVLLRFYCFLGFLWILLGSLCGLGGFLYFGFIVGFDGVLLYFEFLVGFIGFLLCGLGGFY